jgi:RimJ/RimL family protein N-acetyltransferase
MNDKSSRTEIPFIETNQVYLRRINLEDANSQYLNWVNDPKITQFLETGFFPTGSTELEEYIGEKLNDDTTLFLAIIDDDTESHIGNIKLGPINWIHRRADVGILIGDREYWGQGIATESIRAVVKHAFKNLNIHKLTASCYEDNTGSLKAFENVGFKVEGRRPKHAHYDGAYTKLIELGLLRENLNS